MIESIAGGELDLYKFQSYLNQYKLAISALKNKGETDVITNR